MGLLTFQNLGSTLVSVFWAQLWFARLCELPSSSPSGECPCVASSPPSRGPWPLYSTDHSNLWRHTAVGYVWDSMDLYYLWRHTAVGYVWDSIDLYYLWRHTAVGYVWDSMDLYYLWRHTAVGYVWDSMDLCPTTLKYESESWS